MSELMLFDPIPAHSAVTKIAGKVYRITIGMHPLNAKYLRTFRHIVSVRLSKKKGLASLPPGQRWYTVSSLTQLVNNQGGFSAVRFHYAETPNEVGS